MNNTKVSSNFQAQYKFYGPRGLGQPEMQPKSHFNNVGVYLNKKLGAFRSFDTNDVH